MYYFYPNDLNILKKNYTHNIFYHFYSQGYPTLSSILSLYTIIHICKVLRSKNKYIRVYIFLSCGQPDNDHIWSKRIADL